MRKPVAGLLRPLFQREVFAMLALSTELLEDLANQVLTDYFGTDHFPIHPVEIELFARHYLRLNIQYDNLCYGDESLEVNSEELKIHRTQAVLRLLGSYFSVLRQRNTSLGRHFAPPLGLRIRSANSMKSLVRGQI